jgi:hypothetical protein
MIKASRMIKNRALGSKWGLHRGRHSRRNTEIAKTKTPSHGGSLQPFSWTRASLLQKLS